MNNLEIILEAMKNLSSIKSDLDDLAIEWHEMGMNDNQSSVKIHQATMDIVAALKKLSSVVNYRLNHVEYEEVK